MGQTFESLHLPQLDLRQPGVPHETTWHPKVELAKDCWRIPHPHGRLATGRSFPVSYFIFCVISIPMRQLRNLPQESPVLVEEPQQQLKQQVDGCHHDQSAAIGVLMERLAEKMTPMESECIFRLNTLTKQLEATTTTTTTTTSNDQHRIEEKESSAILHHLDLSNAIFGSSSAPSLYNYSSEFLLEHASVQTALADCCLAIQRNMTLTSMTVGGLPERELELILAHLPMSLERLTIQNTSRSQTISTKALLRSLPTTSSLTYINIDARIRLRYPSDACLLAHGLSKLIRLEHLELQLLPRIAMHSTTTNPPFTLDCLLQSLTALCAKQIVIATNNQNDFTKQQQRHLHTVKWTAGYQHNYYHGSLIHHQVLADFLAVAKDHLQELQLDNFGLRDQHLRNIVEYGSANAQLERLRLAQHHPNAFSLSSANLLLEHSNLQECILWNALECATRKQQYCDFWHLQQRLHLHCLIRKCSNATPNGSFGHAILMAASDPSEHSLGAIYALVRYNPSQLMATNKNESVGLLKRDDTD